MLSVLRGNLKFKLFFFSLNIHICNHSCTWKELLNYKNFLRRFPLLRGQKIRHFNILSLDMNCCVNVVYFSERADSYG